MFEFKITDLKDASNVALNWATKTISIIDTTGVEIPFFIKDVDAHRVFVFDDLNSEKEECHRPGMHQAPTMHDVRVILEYTETFTSEDKILFHCHGGICRSPSVAILALIQHGATVEEAVEKVLEARPQMWPNTLIIRLGDVALEMNGTLIQFVNDWMDKNVNKIVW